MESLSQQGGCLQCWWESWANLYPNPYPSPCQDRATTLTNQLQLGWAVVQSLARSLLFLVAWSIPLKSLKWYSKILHLHALPKRMRCRSRTQLPWRLFNSSYLKPHLWNTAAISGIWVYVKESYLFCISGTGTGLIVCKDVVWKYTKSAFASQSMWLSSSYSSHNFCFHFDTSMLFEEQTFPTLLTLRVQCFKEKDTAASWKEPSELGYLQMQRLMQRQLPSQVKNTCRKYFHWKD